jgi:DNA-directed RNA polymerase subunit RPC12/RpoP
MREVGGSMNAYTCPHCKKPYYSAAEPENWRAFDCPNCGKTEDEDELQGQKAAE